MALLQPEEDSAQVEYGFHGLDRWEEFHGG